MMFLTRTITGNVRARSSAWGTTLATRSQPGKITVCQRGNFHSNFRADRHKGNTLFDDVCDHFNLVQRRHLHQGITLFDPPPISVNSAVDEASENARSARVFQESIPCSSCTTACCMATRRACHSICSRQGPARASLVSANGFSVSLLSCHRGTRWPLLQGVPRPMWPGPVAVSPGAETLRDWYSACAFSRASLPWHVPSPQDACRFPAHMPIQIASVQFLIPP